MDTAQWPQEIVVKPMEEIVPNTNTYSKPSLEKRAKPQKDQAVNCPRCNSTNTKFCYYNNYSLTQPRYFCKTCRRYWTEGGTLRNIPVGGGSRKNKRPSSSSSSSSSSKKLNTDHVPQHPTTSQNPKFNHEGQDLNLGFSSTNDFKTFSQLIQAPNSSSALELLSGISSRGGLSSFMPMAPIMDPNAVFSSGFSLPEFKPSLTFSLDGLGNSGYGSLQETGGSGRVLFPFEDLKQVSNTATEAERNREQGDSTGYWSGMLGGGSW